MGLCLLGANRKRGNVTIDVDKLLIAEQLNWPVGRLAGYTQLVVYLTGLDAVYIEIGVKEILLHICEYWVGGIRLFRQPRRFSTSLNQQTICSGNMPKVTVTQCSIEGSMSEIINFTRLLTRPYGGRNTRVCMFCIFVVRLSWFRSRFDYILGICMYYRI